MKVRYFWIGLAIVICSWLGNFIYFQSKQLAQPIFFDHYYETYIPEEDTLKFKLYYLGNKMNPSDAEVNYAVIDGITAYPVSNEGMWRWSQNDPYIQYEQEYIHHYLKSVTLEIHPFDLPIQQGTDDIWSFEEIQVTFKNGQTVEADIGEVIVYGKFSPPTMMEERYGSGSNQYYHDSYMKILQSLTIEEISIPFEDEIGGNLLLKLGLDKDILNSLDDSAFSPSVSHDWYKENKLNMKDDEKSAITVYDGLFPIHLNEDDLLKLFIRLNPEHRSYYYFDIRIEGTTDNGETFVHKKPIIDMPYFTQRTINEIIAEKQGGFN